MARSTKKQGNGAPLGFEASLLQAADKLRKNMDAGEYKHVVLGLILRCGNRRTVKLLPKNALELPHIAVPPLDLVARFEAIVLPLHSRVEAAVMEREGLAALRDTLLPKFLSGELRVRDAERAVEAAT